MFVHLRCHSQYSLLEGSGWIEQIVEKAKSFQMPALALTDTNQLFGAVDFYLSAKAEGVKAILGCKLLVQPLSDSVEGALNTYEWIVLCKDLEGYQNLCKIVTESYLKQKLGKPPRADFDLLEKYKKGLIVLGGALKNEIGFLVYRGEEDKAIELTKRMKSLFKDDFYLELLDSGISEQEALHAWCDKTGKKLKIECVATNDCHYIDPKDQEAHEILQSIEAGKNLDFERPKSLVPKQFHFKSPEEMAARMQAYPDSVENTLKVAEKCNVVFKFKDEKGNPIYHLPDFRPDGISKDQPFQTEQYLWDLSHKGFEKRWNSHAFKTLREGAGAAEIKKSYIERLQDELKMIQKTGFSGYFLIVADFVNWAKDNAIPVGPGRGSGAGSLVAYALQITDVDPILYKLLFERFINPERISLPDFDIDFCQERRGEVIDYVTRKYGKDNVAQIITFGKLQARAVIKDVGRVLGLAYSDTDQLSKLLPNELNITLEKALREEPRLRERMDADPRLAKVMEYSLALEGLYRNAGIHAAGVIITENPVVSYCPLYVSKDGDVVTQFDKDFGEKIGLVKFDFLGLKTLTVIDYAVRFVHEREKREGKKELFNMELIDYFDTKVFELISSGDTDGVFQVESSGMKDLCVRLNPASVEDITAISGLFRPGPLGSGMVDDFIDRRHGRKPIEYPDPRLDKILKDTYGIIVYQEQVMQIARELAGYSLGQADLLRRAMGKKKPEEMAKQREIFVKGCLDKGGLTPAKAEAIFDLMAKFAEYGFNKSHSTAYSVITFQTAYLKTYYPAEFMAALMTTEMDNTDKLSKYIADTRAHDIKVLSPDVNVSGRKFNVEEDGHAIRFGLEAIKGVGSVAVDEILAEREKKPFQTILDFCSRLPTRKVNKKVMESLILSGAVDCIAGESNRPSLLASIEALLEMASDEQEERELGQNSLFDAFDANEVKLRAAPTTLIKSMDDFPHSRKLTLEKQTLGFYLSGHPMDPWQKITTQWLGWDIERLQAYAEQASEKPAQKQEWGAGPGGRFRPNRKEISLAGVFGSIKEIKTKKGTRMAFSELEDLKGKVEVVFFPEAFEKNEEALKRALQDAEPVILDAEVSVEEKNAKLFAKSIRNLAESHRTRVQRVVLKLSPNEVKPEQLRELKQRLMEFRGKCPVRIDFLDSEFKTSMELSNSLQVEATPQLVVRLNQLFGRDVVSFQ